MKNISQNEELFFSSHINEFHVVEKDILFNDLAKTNFTDFHKKESTTYLLVKTRKIKFIPDSFSVMENYCICGDVFVGGKKQTVVFNVAKLLFEQSGVKNKYSGWEEWADSVMSNWQLDEDKAASGSAKYKRTSSIDLTQSTSDLLYINCKLWQSIKKGDTSVRTVVSTVQTANMFDWYVFDKLEVLYVGKSTDGVLNRAANHNKWGEITSHLDDDEMLLVYFMSISKTSVYKKTIGPVTLISEIDDKSLDIESVSLITEAALIKYFFDEKKYNKDIVNQDFESVKAVKNKLVKRGYGSANVALMLDGVMGYVGTEKSGFHNEHKFEYLFND